MHYYNCTTWHTHPTIDDDIKYQKIHYYQNFLKIHVGYYEGLGIETFKNIMISHKNYLI